MVHARGEEAGTIEVGKLADVAVLSDDYLDPAKVPDEAIKKLKPALTVVDGKVVHDELR
ncbi:MAG TPA: amidohydrolase family protein [Bryobacteraceae bacterium]|nr:amidohydrolase family protein [Bryobacteraceae bacterium]